MSDLLIWGGNKLYRAPACRHRNNKPVADSGKETTTGELNKKRKINAWSTAEHDVPCADQPSYAQLHERHE